MNIEENKTRGYIALFRSLQKHWLYPEGRAFTEYEAWIDLLLEANHKVRTVRVKNQLINCKRGESVRSITQWAERWNWSRSKVYRFLNLLQDDGMIKTVSETVTSRITICNYDSYQNPKSETETEIKQGRNEGETEVKRPRNDPETVSNTNKNVNNANNENHEREEAHSLAIQLSELINQTYPENPKITNDEIIRSTGALSQMVAEGWQPNQIATTLQSLYSKNLEPCIFWRPKINSGTDLKKHFSKIVKDLNEAQKVADGSRKKTKGDEAVEFLTRRQNNCPGPENGRFTG